MDKKILAILMILLAGASFLTMGCAGKRNDSVAEPTIAAPAVTALANSSYNSLDMDTSMVELSGEGDEPYPESGLPTPTLD